MTRLLLLALLIAVPLSAAQSAETERPRTISVQGSGTVYGKPDIASASAGIESRGATPEDALAANTKAMNSIMTAIKRYGIAERDIETSSFSVNPVYAQQPGPRGSMTIEGYQVSNQVTVRLRDMDKLGGLLSSLVEAGANRLHGVSFDIAEPAKLQDEARKAAIADAKKRADLYAAAAGVAVKRVLTISEGGGFAPPQPMAMRAMKAGGESVPVAGGEQSIGANVSVVYEIE
ncbi:MAG: hypothetical protein K0Q70_828 [Rhodospirillales bacterium]|jgi:uncharacterized protein YggE|nr:hypothetical protein [Rhodospirillales bacterium]